MSGIQTIQETTTTTVSGKEAYLEPCIPDIWPNGTKNNQGMRWAVFKAFASVTATFCCCVYYLAPLSMMGTPVLLWMRPRLGCTVLAVCAASLACPSKNWPAFRRFWQHLFYVFNVRCNFNEVSPRIDRKKRYIFAMHPHAIVPLHALIFCSYLDRQDRNLYGYGGMANIIYYVPIVRNIFMWLNNVSASYNVMKKVLLEKKKNVFLLPDGIKGISYARPRQHVVCIKKRRGLFRLAMEGGAEIIPIYCFGANDQLNQASFGDSLIGRLSRKFRISLCIFWGQLGVPIPFFADMSYVWGEPVAAPKLKPGADSAAHAAAIEKFYEDYVASLRTAFDTYKAAAGHPEGELKVV